MMAASFPATMGRFAGLARQLGWLLALLSPLALPPTLAPLPAGAQPRLSAGAQPLLAAGNPKFDPAVYPPPDTFRNLQLALLACGRENTAALCEQVRQQADPLLDHPRLPSACKDVLWNIRQKAVVGAADDLNRRDRIEKLAREVSAICSPQVKPKANSEGSGSGSGPGQRGGIRFNSPGTR
jgi:hypothetical protein